MLYLTVDIPIVYQYQYVLLLHYFIRENGNSDYYIFISPQCCTKVEFLMLLQMNLTLGAEMFLLKRHFFVTVSDVGVIKSHG